MFDTLENLLKDPRIWRGQVQSGETDWQRLSSGYPKLDQCLPDGGWPRYALTEILLEHYGTGELQLLKGRAEDQLNAMLTQGQLAAVRRSLRD